jgi:hypothetical protein
MSRQGLRRTRLGIAGIAVLLFGMLGAGVAHAASSYSVFVGYADTLRANPAAFPTPFDTAPGVTNQGQPSSVQLDSGAVRIQNTSGATETVNSVVVNVGPNQFDLWPHNVILPSFNQLVLDQTSQFNFDSSDVPNVSCTPNGVIPTVTVTVDGVATTYNDTGQILNTGGIDKSSCPTGTNESTQWVSIGQQPCQTGAVLTETPATQTHNVGQQATVNANFSACGTPLTGATVNFKVLSGPNAGTTGSGPVDGSGNASFTYTGSGGGGTDTVQASVTNGGGTITSNNVSVIWLAGVTAVSGNAYGESIDLTTLLNIHVVSGPTPTVTLPSTGGGPFNNSLANLTVPNVLSAVALNVTTKGSLGPNGVAQSRASVADAAVNRLLTATAVTSVCQSTKNGSTGSTSVLGLAIVGHTVINGTVAPNTTITVPGIGKVILGERIITNTATHTQVDENAVHVVLNGILGHGDIIIAHSHCDTDHA